MAKPFTRAGDLPFLQDLTQTNTADRASAQTGFLPASLQNGKGMVSRALVKQEGSNVIQLPLWHDLELFGQLPESRPFG